MTLLSTALKIDPLSEAEAAHMLGVRDRGVLHLDAQGRILNANFFFASLLAYAPDDLQGKLLAELGMPSHALANRKAVDWLLQHGHLRNTDMVLKSGDDMLVNFEFRCAGRLANGVQLIECLFHELEVCPPSGTVAAPPGPDAPRRHILHLRRFEEIMRREIERTRLQGPPLSLLSIGVDRMRASQSSAAPIALRRVARACANLLRATDVVGRISEASFVALLPGVDTKGALCAAERLRTAIANMEIPATGERTKRITVSIGVVSTRTGRTSYKALMSRAEAKRDSANSIGGNRVNA